MKKLLLVLSIVTCCSVFTRLYASHVMGADLTFACIGPNQYLVTLQAYRDCNGIVLSGPITIDYSSVQCGVHSQLQLTQVGPAVDITPICFAATDACNGGSGYGIQRYTFQGTLNLPAGCGSDWVLSWTVCCRNAAITTLNNPGNDNLYIEADLNNTLATCVSSPTFANDPVAIYCDNFPQFFNHGAIAPSGDSLAYYLLPSLTASGVPVVYNAGYSATSPMGTASGTNINSQTGQLSFTPNQTQIAVMKVGVNEYQNGVLVAHVERDMQIIVTNCTNSAPTSGGINGATGANANTFTTTACSNSCFTIQTVDSSAADSVYWSWVGSNLPGATITSSGGAKPLLTICWAPTQADVGTHNFIINLRNNDCPYNGTASIAYTVVVTGASDPPVNAGPDVYLCPGQSTTLTATSTGAPTSYSWSDGTNTHSGASWTVNPAVTTVYTVTAVYSNGCQLTDQVVVYRDLPPTVTAFPPVTTLCSTSDSVQLTAFISGGTGTFLWSPAAGLTCTTCPDPKASPSVSTTYQLVAVDSAGCQSPPFPVTVNLAPPPPAQSCSVIYATPTGTGPGTQTNPSNLLAAIDSAACNNAVIKLAIGTYVINNPITNITSYTTLEGGFDPANNWQKTSQAGATIIERSALNMEGTGNNKRLEAIYMNGNSYFRFQDLTIETDNCPALAAGDTFGYSNYVMHMTNCSNYNFVRCQILPGTASGGLAGTTPAGAGGASTGGVGGAGGAGSGTGCHQNGTAGTAGGNASSGAGGGAGGGGASGNGCNTVGCGANAVTGGNGGTGVAGVVGTSASGLPPAAPGTNTTFFNVAGQSASGTNGTGGGGGGGGGGGSEGSDCTCSVNGNCNGGSGGNGGNGGLAGTGGWGGGGSFGIYLFGNGAGGVITDCNIAANTAGAGGTGAVGQAAGAVTAPGAGATAGGSCSPHGQGGNGGAGGAGGNGGNGQPGAPGVSAEIISNGTVPTYTAAGVATTIVTGINNPTPFNLAAQTVIHAANISCTNRNDTLSSAASGTWNAGAGATVATGTTASLITQYTTTGRKDIVYNGSTYTGFVDIAINQNSFVPVIQSSAAVLNTDTFWICQGSTADFDMQIASADTFDWNFGGATVPNTYTGPGFANLSNLPFNTAGTFMILGRIKTSCCGWSPYDTAYILVEPQATLTYTGDTAFCPGDSAHIILTGTGTSYLWSPVAGLSSSTGTNVYAFPQATTTYLVTSYSPRGLCNADTSIPVYKLINPTLSFTIIPAGCGSIGSATVVPTPAGTYTYQWNPTGATTATISNQPSGTYDVTVTPVGSSCSTTGATSIGTNGGLQAYMSKTIAPLCNGGCTGQLGVEAIGGTAPFQYHWSTGTTGIDSLNNLCANTYSVTITDANLCTAATTQILPQPLPLVLAVLDSSSPHCAGQCTGSAHLDGQGGTGPYTFVWSPVVTPATGTPVNLCSGNYSITVTDNNNCTAAGSLTITAPTAMNVNFVQVNDSCAGVCDGNATASVTNGTSPYTFAWSNGTTGARDSNLCVNNYTLTVTDSFTCTVSASVNITAPPALTASISSSINDSCFGQCNGRITAAGAGGTSPYTYLWSNGTTGATDSNLCHGPYTVTVKDAMGCTAVNSYTVTEPVVLSVSSTIVDVSCFGLCDGSVTAIPAGGTSPYTYAWSGSAVTAALDPNLCMGPYTVTVKDDMACTASWLSNVTQPTQLTLALTDSGNANCFGQCNGLITVAAAGGTAAYSYAWSSSGSGTTDNTLCANTYTITATDAHLCTATVSYAVTQPARIVADTLSTLPPTCYGGNNGAITLQVSGGAYPYTYMWPQATPITDSLGINLIAGTYSIYITDAHGCKDTVNTALSQPGRLSPQYTLDSISCNGANNATITFTTSGGTGPYQYSLDGGTYQPGGTFTGLTAGAHTVTVHDAHNCDSIVAFNVYQPPPLSVSMVSTTNDSCFGECDGVIVLSGAGGTPPYQYSSDGVTFTSSPAIGNLCANPSYTITIRDTNGCTNAVPAAITQPSQLVLSPLDSVQPSCNDGTNGSFAVIASGGTPAYMYSADGGPYQASGNFTNQSAGTHIDTVQDANRCIATYTITVPNPPATSSFDTATTPETCFGGNTGTITTTITGTITPYTYSWSPGGATTPGLTGLTAGIYVVTITDGNGCRVFGPDSVTVWQPSQISYTNSMTPVTCFGDSNGCITVTPSGGTPGYTHSWSNGNTTNNPCSLVAGSYSDTITDMNGCQVTDANIQVTQPPQLTIAVDSVTSVSCFGDSNGVITVSGAGGTPGYQYAWSTGATGDPLNGLKVGSYSVTATDSHGCTVTDSASIAVVSPMVFNAQKNDVLCPPLQNGYINLPITGGSPGYQFTWSNGFTGSTLSGLPVGVYNVTVTDARGCFIDTSFVIINDSAFSITAIPDTATVNEGDNIQLGLQVMSNGAGNPSSITWTPSSGLSCDDCQGPLATPLFTTQYMVSAVSDSGCTSSSQVLITVVPQHQLYIPNAFTPNGDGINDFWEAFGNKKDWIFLEVKVFDRWGEKIFESNDIDFQWDGRYRGTLVEPGEYVYTFKLVFIDDYTVKNKGSITVIR